MSSATSKLPGFLLFACMFFMQPRRLHQRLVTCGIENPTAAGGELFLRPGLDRPVRRAFVNRMLFLLFTSTPCVVFLSGQLIIWLGFQIEWKVFTTGAYLGIATGFASGIVGSSYMGVVFGMVSGLAAITQGVPPGVPQGVVTGMTMASSWYYFILSEKELTSPPIAWASGIFFLVEFLFSIELIVFDPSFFHYFLSNMNIQMSLPPGTLASVFTMAAVAIGLLLLQSGVLTWPFESAFQTLIYSCQRLFSFNTLNSTPILWHDQSYLPLPFLGQHIELTAEQDPALARRVLDACAVAPSQRGIGRRTLERLQGRELLAVAREGQFKVFIEGQTTWLPPEEGADPVVGQLRQVARLLVAAEGSSFAHHRMEHLRNAEKAFDGAEVQLLQRSSSLASAYRPAMPAWREAISKRRTSAELEAADFLPVPFRAGEPLDPERGREVFRGRESSIREIESHLALATEARSVVLLGPRRTGKSSLLRMLPVMLPDAVCIFFDLQGNPVETPEGFFRALVKETRDQARRTRQLKLPELPPGPPFEAAAAWIEALENTLGERRLLICIDEYEALERSFGGSREDLLRLMGLLRSTILHSRKVRLLVAGEAPFDELDPMWDAHFVSVREVRLGHLDKEVAVELVRHPIPSFPDSAIPESVSRKLVERTGAQPYLVQLFAQLLVSRLNDEKRNEANLTDLEAAEEEALTQVGSYFRDLWNRAPPPAKEVLAALSRGETPEIPKAARRWLDRRCLIDAEGRLTIPVLGRFLLEEVLD